MTPSEEWRRCLTIYNHMCTDSMYNPGNIPGYQITDLGLSHQKQLMPYGRDSCFAWNRCHIFLNKRGTYGIIADDLRFATQLSNVYGNAIRAKLANAQTTRSVADPFSSFVTQNLQSICSLCHRNPRFFIKIGDPIPLQIHESCHSPRPMPKAVFVSADCGTAKEKSRTFLQRTALLNWKF